jgi:hypothetical protein
MLRNIWPTPRRLSICFRQLGLIVCSAVDGSKVSAYCKISLLKFRIRADRTRELRNGLHTDRGTTCLALLDLKTEDERLAARFSILARLRSIFEVNIQIIARPNVGAGFKHTRH